MGNIALAPELIIIILAFVNLLFGAFKAKYHQYIIRILTIGSVISALILILMQFNIAKETMFGHMVLHDVFSNYVKIIILISFAFILLLHFGISRDLKILSEFEFPIILSFAVVGTMLLVSSNNLLILYMGLELFSLPLYIAASFNRNQSISSEAGLKYFILGSFSTGILLYGISLIYGFTGTIDFSSLAYFIKSHERLPIAVIVGIVMILISLCFKISAAPFHMWAPDVYEGSPTLVTLFFSTIPKIAVLAIFSRLVIQVFPENIINFNQIISVIAIVSMIIGAVGAVIQTNFKRLLAYSSINHIGFALIGLVIGEIESIQAMLIYITIYIIMNLGLFSFILSLNIDGKLLEKIEDFSGIAKTNLDKSLVILIIIASMAGIPPLAGFFGKFYILNSAFESQHYLLAMVALLTTVISAYYYLRIIKVIFFNEPIYPKFPKSSLEVKLILSISVIFILFFFCFPNIILKSSFISALTLLMENV